MIKKLWNWWLNVPRQHIAMGALIFVVTLLLLGIFA